nr:M15 family metallopeptidase [Acidimicrobiia bacterium]
VVGGANLIVAGVVDDVAVGTAEVVAHAADAGRLGLDPARFVLLGTTGAVGALEEEVAAVLTPHPRVLAATLGPFPWPTSWREVLPTALVKARFGEFSLRPTAGRSVAQEPGWAEANMGTATVPVLGEVRCHRAVLGPLTAALEELEAAGLAGLLRPGDYGGCFSPRLIAAGSSVSRHAWGLAVDVNVSTNPFGAAARQDPRLVEVMERHGFAFGGRWPVPDGMHFEYRET